MRLSCFDLGIDLIFEENKINVLVIENPHVYAALVEKLVRQYEGDIILSEDEKILSLQKSLDIIFSPTLIDLNSKRILNYLYQEMKGVSEEEFSVEKERANSAVVTYLDTIIEKIPYPIVYNLDFDCIAIFKQYDVKIDYQSQSLLEQIINYIQLDRWLCTTKIIMFLNLKAYLDAEQLSELYKFAFYNKIYLLLLEDKENDCLPEEKYYIIDKDKCLIEH